MWILNAWRNIANDPILQNNLAVCDDTSLVKPDDFISADFINRPDLGGKIEQYRMASRNAHMHKWYYLPRMTRDEVILFKQYDSDYNQSARACFHTAFSDPTAPADAPPRQSIEVRAILFYPDHTPNTCPEVAQTTETEKTSPVTPKQAANNVKLSIEAIACWPPMAQAIFRWMVTSEAGAARFLDSLLKDRSNRMGLKDASSETRNATRDLLLADKDHSLYEEMYKITRTKLVRIVQARRKASPFTWFLNPFNWF